jgi:hypothetical protein
MLNIESFVHFHACNEEKNKKTKLKLLAVWIHNFLHKWIMINLKLVVTLCEYSVLALFVGNFPILFYTIYI